MMSKNLRTGLLTLACLLVTPAILWAAGNWSTLPIVGSPAVCVSNVSGTGGPTAPYLIVPANTQGTTQGICGQVMPAGPIALTGNELIPADTGLANGAPPQTVVIPAGLLGSSTNRLIGSDMTTNLAQVPSTVKGLATLVGSPTAAIITADRWWVIAPAAGVTTTIDSTASTAVIPGINNTKALRVARTTSGAAGVVCVGQTLDTAQASTLIGKNAIFSFYEENGAGQSATNGNIVVNIDYTSQADGAATQATIGYAGVNGSLFAKLDTGGTTTGLANATQAVTGFSPGTTGTLTAGLTNGFSATIPASTTWTRYAVYAAIPATIPNTTTPVTEVSVSICWTPIATTAITTDYIEINNMQLEAASSTVTANLPAGIVSPKSYQVVDAATEHNREYYYWYYNYENQSLITTVATCENATTGTANCTLPLPVPMRLAPAAKYTAGFQAFVQVAETSVGACTALAATTSYALVPSNAVLSMTCTASTVGAAGTANQLSTLGTSASSGIKSASAEP